MARPTSVTILRIAITVAVAGASACAVADVARHRDGRRVVGSTKSAGVVRDNHWSPTGSMREVRSGHVATLLRDGRVLVAGGMGTAYKMHASAEIYDPLTGTWRSAKPMAAPLDPYVESKMLLLPSGEVLLTNGRTVDIYDPGADAWRSLLRKSVWIRQAIPLSTGDVFLWGSRDSELYDSITRKSTPVALPPETIFAAALDDGRMLRGDEFPGSSWATIDPRTGEGEPVDKAPTASPDRQAVGTTLLRDGRLLLTGGFRTFTVLGSHHSKVRRSEDLPITQVFDPSDGEWDAFSPAHKLASGGRSTPLLLADGRVLVACGTEVICPPFDGRRYPPCYSSPLRGTDLFDPVTDEWQSIDPMVGAGRCSLSRLPNGGAVAIRFDGGAEVFDPDTRSWTSIGSRAAVPYPEGASATPLGDGRVLVAGGGATTAEVFSLLDSGAPCEVDMQCSSGACVESTCE